MLEELAQLVHSFRMSSRMKSYSFGIPLKAFLLEVVLQVSQWLISYMLYRRRFTNTLLVDYIVTLYTRI